MHTYREFALRVTRNRGNSRPSENQTRLTFKLCQFNVALLPHGRCVTESCGGLLITHSPDMLLREAKSHHVRSRSRRGSHHGGRHRLPHQAKGSSSCCSWHRHSCWRRCTVTSDNPEDRQDRGHVAGRRRSSERRWSCGRRSGKCRRLHDRECSNRFRLLLRRWRNCRYRILLLLPASTSTYTALAAARRLRFFGAAAFFFAAAFFLPPPRFFRPGPTSSSASASSVSSLSDSESSDFCLSPSTVSVFSRDVSLCGVAVSSAPPSRPRRPSSFHPSRCAAAAPPPPPPLPLRPPATTLTQLPIQLPSPDEFC